MAAYKQEGNRLIWQFDGEQLVIEPWLENSFRVRSTIMRPIEDTEYALLPFTGNQQCTIAIDDQEASITNGKIRAVIRNDGWHRRGYVSFYNQDGKLLMREMSEEGALDKHARLFKPMIGGDFRLTATFESNPDEKLYGMGQYQQEILNIKNCTFELAHRNSQASVPFVLSSEGYGFLWHNPAIGRASFGRNYTEWYAESTKQLDYWITAGDSPKEIERAYARATGTVPMMPEYGLGFWQCKLRYYNQEQVLNVAREYKRRSLPIDVIVVDFFHWPKMGDFRFDEEFFPDPKAMADELKSMGIELMVSIWPQVDHKSENMAEMQENGYLVRTEMGMNVQMQFNGGNIAFFDATNPEARKYVWEKCKQNYYDKGVRIFWLDEAEPEYGGYDFANYRYSIGPNVQVGNVYPQLYSRTFYEGMTAQGQKNVVNLVRCAWAGSQRYGALVWSGDIHSSWEHFRRQVCAGLHMGICGIPWWTTDIGGFTGGDPTDKAFQQLLVRWFQFGAFCPVMRLHGDRVPAEPVARKNGERMLNSGSNNEVWSYGEEAYEILAKYLRLRETLRSYTRDLMRQAHESGDPVIRTLFYEFPEDAACWDIKDQYLFGSDLLIAPVLNADTWERSVYLPHGASWTNAHDGVVYAGGQIVRAAAPLDVIPVFLRNGQPADLIGRI
jgi:alpha-D-xyloside xylohydrolase